MSVTQPLKKKSNTKRLNPGVANQRKRERGKMPNKNK
jgi:hypothetical protein